MHTSSLLELLQLSFNWLLCLWVFPTHSHQINPMWNINLCCHSASTCSVAFNVCRKRPCSFPWHRDTPAPYRALMHSTNMKWIHPSPGAMLCLCVFAHIIFSSWHVSHPAFTWLFCMNLLRIRCDLAQDAIPNNACLDWDFMNLMPLSLFARATSFSS